MLSHLAESSDPPALLCSHPGGECSASLSRRFGVLTLQHDGVALYDLQRPQKVRWCWCWCWWCRFEGPLMGQSRMGT